MRSPGIAYQVHYGIPVVGDPSEYRKGGGQMRWTKCSVRFPRAGRLPDGSYFLYTDEGRVHQLKSVDGSWQCLALAA
jgi:hypothetical protein